MDRMNSELYHKQNTLLVTGSGMIILALWSFLKMVLYLTMARSNAMELMDITETKGVSKDFLYVGASAILIILLAIDTLLRIYVGMSARAEARGKRKSGLYLFLAWCMAIVGAVTVIGTIVNTLSMIGATFTGQTLKGTTGIGDSIASAILDSVSLFITIGLIRSARYIRKVRKSEERKG